jgi:threonine dehydratase
MVIAGQGTIGLEILDEVPEVEVVVVPVGGGGLIAGVATAIKALRPRSASSASKPRVRPRLLAALAAGHPVTLPEVHTMADGIAVGAVSELTYAHAVPSVDEVVTVTEEEISRAILVLLERSKWVVEPAGAVASLRCSRERSQGTGPAVATPVGGQRRSSAPSPTDRTRALGSRPLPDRARRARRSARLARPPDRRSRRART